MTDIDTILSRSERYGPAVTHNPASIVAMDACGAIDDDKWRNAAKAILAAELVRLLATLVSCTHRPSPIDPDRACIASGKGVIFSNLIGTVEAALANWKKLGEAE